MNSKSEFKQPAVPTTREPPGHHHQGATWRGERRRTGREGRRRRQREGREGQWEREEPSGLSP